MASVWRNRYISHDTKKYKGNLTWTKLWKKREYLLIQCILKATLSLKEGKNMFSQMQENCVLFQNSYFIATLINVVFYSFYCLLVLYVCLYACMYVCIYIIIMLPSAAHVLETYNDYTQYRIHLPLHTGE